MSAGKIALRQFHVIETILLHKFHSLGHCIQVEDQKSCLAAILLLQVLHTIPSIGVKSVSIFQTYLDGRLRCLVIRHRRIQQNSFRSRFLSFSPEKPILQLFPARFGGGHSAVQRVFLHHSLRIRVQRSCRRRAGIAMGNRHHLLPRSIALPPGTNFHCFLHRPQKRGAEQDHCDTNCDKRPSLGRNRTPFRCLRLLFQVLSPIENGTRPSQPPRVITLLFLLL